MTFAGQGWREVPQSRELMFATFQVMRPLHELLWYLNEAMARARSRPLQEELVRAYDETELLTRQSADDVLAVDVGAQRDLVNVLLSRVSELVRADARRGRKPSKAVREVGPGTDLVGAKREECICAARTCEERISSGRIFDVRTCAERT